MPGIGLILNPKSRRHAGDPTAEARFSRYLGSDGIVRTVRSVDELRHIAQDFRERDIDVLAIGGGDGTTHVTLGPFVEVYRDRAIPKLALLRGGTMNTVANSVGVPHGTPDQLLRRLLQIYRRGGDRIAGAGEIAEVTGIADGAAIAFEERHLLRVTASDEPRAHYGFLFGTGVTYGFLAEYYRHANPTPLAAVEVLLRCAASALVGGRTIRRMAEPFRGSATLEGGPSWPEHDYLALAAGTIAHIGLGFKPFYRYRERPNAFHALGVRASPGAFVRELGRVRRGRPMRPTAAYDAVTSRLVVHGAMKPIRYMIDGDLHDASSDLVVSAGPLVRILV
jgi:diacylglycerol kinase (ATP)